MNESCLIYDDIIDDVISEEEIYLTDEVELEDNLDDYADIMGI
jgi:hypothetical protein